MFRNLKARVEVEGENQ